MLKGIPPAISPELMYTLMKMGHGNPELMENMAGLMEEMKAGEIEQLTAAAATIQETFIKDSGLRELLHQDGVVERLVSFLKCMSVLRRPVDKEGIGRSQRRIPNPG